MTALKLFVSHSSRLDDVEHKYTRDNRNWRLLEETCEAAKHEYGDRIEVLVDKDGLLPGDDWNHQLNLWLAECHVAIILFSKHAIEKSDWVAKEAAILSWRAELDKDFTLIPVMLDGEATPEDLAKDFLGVLKIDTNQCIRNAKTAADILVGILHKLGGPEDLAGTYPQTPLERLRGGIAKLLADGATTDSLKEALQAVGCSVAPNSRLKQAHYADLLARRFLTPSSDHIADCFSTFQLGIDPLTPRPALGSVRELLRLVRPLWVRPEAAAHLPQALRGKRPLALAGRFITFSDPYLETQAYTLERYLERAWPGSSLFCFVTVAGSSELDQVREEIRRCFHGPGIPPMIDGSTQDRMINKDPRTIVLVVVASSDTGGLPDALLLRDLQQLETEYQRLLLIFALEPTSDALPETLKVVRPQLDPLCEQQAYLGERAARTFLNSNYGSGP